MTATAPDRQSVPCGGCQAELAAPANLRPGQTVLCTDCVEGAADAVDAALLPSERPAEEPVPLEDLAPVAAPWERQEGETALSFQRFCLYRDMGPEGRSLRALARQLDLSTTAVAQQSVANRWVRRAEEWDEYRDREAREATLSGIRKMNERQAALGVALQALASRRVRSIQVEELSPSEIVRLADLGHRMERLARGAATDNIEGQVGMTVSQVLRGIRERATDDGLD